MDLEKHCDGLSNEECAINAVSPMHDKEEQATKIVHQHVSDEDMTRSRS